METVEQRFARDVSKMSADRFARKYGSVPTDRLYRLYVKADGTSCFQGYVHNPPA